MLHHTKMRPQGAKGIFCPSFFATFTGFVLLLLLQTSTVSAQTLSLVYNPSNFQIGDTVDLELWVESDASVNGLTMTFYLDDNAVDWSNAELKVPATSWLGDAADIEESWTESSGQHTVTLLRTDEELRSGDGHVATLGGIIIVDDLHTRLAPPMVKGLGAPRLKVWPNPNRGKFKVDLPPGTERLELVDARGGRMVLPLQNAYALPELLSGCYYLRAFLENGEVRQQRMQVLK